MPKLQVSIARSVNLTLIGLTVILCGCGANAGSAAAPVSDGKIVSASELAKVIDLSRIPAPQGARFGDRNAAELNVYVPLKVVPATEFYLRELEKLGYTPSKEPALTTIQNDYSSVTLVKGGYSLFLSATPSEEGQSLVSLIRYGNYDARRLPQSEGAKQGYGSPTLMHYVAKGSVAEECDFVMKALAKEGWQQYFQPNTSYTEDPKQRSMMFRNKGYRLNVSVGEAPAQQNKTMVQYQLYTLANELPAPAEAKNVEFDDEENVLTCIIPGDIEVADKFYRKAMPEVGCKALEHDEPKETTRLQRYETAEKGIYLVTMKNEDQKETKVEFLYYSPELLKKMRESEGKPAEKTDAEPPTTAPSDDAPKRKPIFAKLLPLPAKTLDLKFDADGQSIQFRSSEAIPALVKSMKQSFEAADWKELPGSTTADANAGAMVLQKEDALLTFVLINTGLGDGTTVMINGNGLDWSDQAAEKD